MKSMKIPVWVFILMLALAATVFGQTAFTAFKVPDSRYTVDFPGKPNVKPTQNLTTKAGVPFTSRAVIAHDNGSTFVFMIATYPTNQEKSDLTDLLPGEADACGGKAELVTKKPYLYSGHPAIYFTVSCPARGTTPEMVIAVTAVAVDNQIVQLMFAATNDSEGGDSEAGAKRADHFMSSMRIEESK